RVSSFRMPVEHSEEELLEALQRRLGLPNLKLGQFRIYQRATDARRGKPVFFSYTIDIIDPDARRLLTEAPAKSTGIVITERPKSAYQCLADHRLRPGSKRPLIVGTGPCGLFAALLLAKLGLRPLLLERGKLAGPRARDVTHFWRTG